MEEEQSNVGQGRDTGVPALPLCDNLHNDTLVKNVGVEDQSYEGGGEIMLEVVGSDVFVDGVSCNREGGLGSGEVAEMETRVLNEDKDVCSNSDKDKMGESELRLSVSRGENGYVEVGLSVDVSCALPLKGGDEVGNKRYVEEVTSPSAVPVCDGADRPLNHVVDGVVGDIGAEEVLPLIANPATRDSDSVTSEGKSNDANSSQDAPFNASLHDHGCQEDVGEVGSDNTCGGDKFLDKSSREDGVVRPINGSCSVEALEDKTQVFTQASSESMLKSEIEFESHCRIDGAPHATQESVMEKSVSGGRVGVKSEDISSFENGQLEISPPDLLIADKHEVVEKSGIPAQNVCIKVETADIIVANSHAEHSHTIVESQASFDAITKECVSPQSCEQRLLGKMSETSNHRVSKIESIDFIPEEINGIGADSGITHVCVSPEISENTELHVSATDILLFDDGDIDVNLVFDMATFSEKGNNFVEEDAQEERNFDVAYHGGYVGGLELGGAEFSSEADKSKLRDEETRKFVDSLQMNHSGYLLPPEAMGCFASSDLVWGKVSNHLWWPGQIFDPADASENAVKYYKKDAYLVAYFGDQTFAWNDPSGLIPFRSHFSQIEKQNFSDAFQDAVDCALKEVTRRVELGLTCSCRPKDAYGEIEYQVIENSGIRQELNRRYGVDHSSQASHFEPKGLLEYIKDLAPRALSGADRLDLAIAQAQLFAFYRFKGMQSPPRFPSTGESLENGQKAASLQCKHALQNGSQKRKERSTTESMNETPHTPDAVDELAGECFGNPKKRKILDPLANGFDKMTSMNATKVCSPPSQSPALKACFKIGKCIHKVATKITGSPVMIERDKYDGTLIDSSSKIMEHPVSQKRGVVISSQSFAADELLSHLQLLAQDPKGRVGHSFQYNIHTFFLGFRTSIVNRRGRKKKVDPKSKGSGEGFEFDDVKDSYWTDRIVQNYSREQLLKNTENGSGNLHLTAFAAEKSAKPDRKPRKRYSTGSYPTMTPGIDETAKRQKQLSSPAELILNFSEKKFVLSEISLNKMFRRYGPLMESETAVDYGSGCAKVIFKRGSDAEVARSSSEKFNIFGQDNVTYEIGYEPVISMKILPVGTPQIQDDTMPRL